MITTTLGSLVQEVWQIAVILLGLLLAVLATGHAVLNNRDSRAAIAWVGFVWLVPLVGAVLYFIFGINRIRHKAIQLRSNLERYRAQVAQPACPTGEWSQHLPGRSQHLRALARVVECVVDRPLLLGNRIDPLINGDEAFPAMLEAIGSSRRTISLVTYLFDRDDVGIEFAAALGEAARRGVEVRVLVDATGAAISGSTIFRTLREEGVRFARFLPALALWNVMSINMRTHRKILVVDGLLGFTGGMNIRIGHCLERNPPNPVRDVHFKVAGPVVTQLQEVFTDDWLFTTGEALRGDAWFPVIETVGPVLARGVTVGPDEHFEKLLWTLLGALSIAQTSIRIVTPYFLPDPVLVAALNLAAMQGVRVDIILPVRSNHPVVHWASRAMWAQVLQHGCRIWLSPPPFDHSKLLIVDGCWVLLGSANWDARSLRLNFEFNLECYDLELARRMGRWFDAKQAVAHAVTVQEVEGRSLQTRLLDGVARLLTPYL